jgi:hypothetical protein
MCKIFYALFFLFQIHVNAQTLSIGDYNIGSDPISIDLNDFRFQVKDPRIKIQFIQNSIYWNRSEKNLVTPMMMIQVTINQTLKPIQIKFGNQIIIPMQKDGTSTSQIYVNLFESRPIEIFEDSKKIDEILIYSISLSNLRKQKIRIDHTCLPYQVQFSGIDTEYISMGCTLDRVGPFGQEKPRLEVNLISTNVLAGNEIGLSEHSDLTFYFNESSEIQTELFHKIEKKKIPIRMSADLPEKLSRVKLAVGIGPYSYTASKNNNALGPINSLSYMLYSKFSLTETTSFKAFDALISDSTLFNNSGLYYSFDVARVLDGRITINTLLGFQGLHFKYDENSSTEFEVIYPQGVEITYQHPFGKINSYLNYGMFLSTSQEPYKNIWLRYGQKIFYEINYITWGKELSKIEMWGLSLGFPIGQFF